MRFTSLVRGFRLRTQYRLPTLLLLTAAISAPVAFWAEREYQYRLRLAAVAALLDKEGASIGVETAGEGPDSFDLIYYAHPGTTLQRNQVVVWAKADSSDKDMSAILRLPTLKALSLHDAPTGQSKEILVGLSPGRTDVPPGITDAEINMFQLYEKKPVPPPLGTIDSSLEKVAQHIELETLYLRHTSISDEGLRHVGGILSLQELELSRTAITDEGLRHLGALSSLRVLKLISTKISGAGFADLASLCQLEDLDLSGADFNDQGARHLASLVSIRSLDLSGTKVTGAAFAYLSAMERLESLYAASDGIGDEGLEHLARLPNLKELNLAGSGVTDEGLKILARSTTIEHLCLDYCDISDDGLAYLAQMKSLTIVGLRGTSVSEWGKEELKRLKPALDTVWMGGTRG